MPSIIIPEVVTEDRLRELISVQYQIWREEKAAREPEFVIENIRFKHDPDWRNNFWSIQSAADCRHYGWKLLRVVYLAAAAAPYIISLVN